MKQAWLAWAQRLRRCFQLLPSIPSRVRNELGALHQMEAEVARIHAEQVRELQQLVERLHKEVNEQLLILMDSVAAGDRRFAEITLRSQLPPPPARVAGLSVLIPCWNQGCFLTEAANSALASLDRLEDPGEVLILDDASRDETKQKANLLVRSDHRIRLLASAENLGLPRARNVLLSQARFEHAIPLDADNQLVPAGVAPLYQAACATGAVMTYGNLAVRDEAGRFLGMLSNDRIGPQLLDQNYIDALVILRTGRLLELNGYNSDRAIGFDDWELNVRLLHGGEPLVFVPTIVGLYRRYGLSMVHDADSLSRRSRNLHRVYGLNGRLPAEAVCASMYHPATGYIWRSPAWQSGKGATAVTGGSKQQSIAVSSMRVSPLTLPSPPETGGEEKSLGDTLALPEAGGEGSRARNAWSGHGTSGPRLLVVSSAGVRNHGDDAILLSTLQRLQRVAPCILPIVITDGESIPPLGRLGRWAGTVEETCRSLNPADVRQGCETYQLASDLATLVGAGKGPAFVPVDFASLDGVLFTGGGNLTDHFPELTARRAALAAAAVAHDVRYSVSGQGIGPITGAVRDQLALLVAGATRFGVRDPLSLEDLRLLPISCDHVELVGDDALGLAQPATGLVDRLLEDVGVPLDQPLLGFHAREAKYVGLTREDLLATAARVDELAAQNGQTVVCFPINTQPWAPETVLMASLVAGLKRRQARWFLVDAKERVDIVAALVARCAAVVSHSYHVALFALATGVPVLLQAGTEYYRRKAEGLRQFFQVRAEIGLPSQADTQWMSQQLRRISQETWSPMRTPVEIDEWLRQALPVRASGREQGSARRVPPTGQRAAA
jgi:polysaccharide pyruvyl transferase WcaK-like protein/GT2 family glycosyltransferase